MRSICKDQVVHEGNIEVHGGQLIDKGLLHVPFCVAQRLHRLLARQLNRLLQALNVCLWKPLRMKQTDARVLAPSL